MAGFKLTIGSTDIINDQAISITNNRPENNISVLAFTINDYKSRSYVDLLDAWTNVELSLKRTGMSNYTKVFSGQVDTLKPSLNTRTGEILTVTCWGKGQAYASTHCNTSYGVESANPGIYTVRDIIQDLTDNYVELPFADGGGDTHWDIDSADTYVMDVHSGCSITNLTSPYLSNLTMVNRLCDVVNAWAQTQGPAEPSIHWYVNPDARIYVKELDTDHSNGDWDRYYGGSQTAATVTQGQHFLEYNFDRKRKDYANRIILSTAFRKPAYDIWCENNGPTWGAYGTDTNEYSNTQHIVGSHSLHGSPDNDAGTTFSLLYYPSTKDANWDFTQVGSQNNPPVLSFYVYCDDATNQFNRSVALFTDSSTYLGGAADEFSYIQYNQVVHPEDDRWIHFEVPIGPYFDLSNKLQYYDSGTPAERYVEWKDTGTPVDWSEVNAIGFFMGTLNTVNWYFDDLHFAGRIIRDAYDSGEITATKKERQIFIRLDNAVDDTLDSAATGGDYSGTAARLATAELYRRTQIGISTAADRFITGTLTMPMKEDLLPGQLLHVRAGKKRNGDFRFDLDMRVKEVTHNVDMNGFTTTVNLTSDTVNTHAPGVIAQWGILMENAGAMGHAEARDLKSSGIDIDVPRLSFDPTV